MANMDYPAPCPNCGAEGECEHREEEEGKEKKDK